MTRVTAWAVLAVLALVAGVLGPCVCLPEAASAEHACCAPPSGYRPAEGGCCPELGSTAAASLSPAPFYTVADLVPVASVTAPLADPPAAAPLAAPAPTLSPPLTARRV